MRYAVIMAGGAGTRLWPMSRPGKPKQLLRFIPAPASAADEPRQAPRSLLQVAAGRLRNLVDPAHVYICTGAAYTEQVLADLPLLPASQLLGEPMGRDTANAVGFSAAVLYKRDPDATFAVLTADHIIEPVEVFEAAMKKAFDAVEKHPEYLVTFGITPTYPATGFGYVQRGAEFADLPGVFKVQAFKEKPPLDTARQYLAAGNYNWNSGMFVWKAKTILDQLGQHLPAAHAGLMKIADAWGTPRQREVLDAVYSTLPKTSIDLAVMEKAPHVATVAMPVKWLDVGSWPAFGETLVADAAGNRTGTGKSQHLGSQNILAVSEDPDHLIATINCKDLIIIHTPGATLVCPAADAERIKQLVAEVEKSGGKQS
ncbi:MAG TPA: mannose-1-phosphate guanylyltransferase [Phycisphaerae bacterium]|nr:mannose-1-phosphate guanylyltransferase [Phycisphaerae bacterium]